MAKRYNIEDIKINELELDRVLKGRNWTRQLLAEKMATSATTLSRKIRYGEFNKMEYRMLCMILGKSEEEMLYKEPVEESMTAPESHVQGILNNSATIQAISELKDKIAQMHADMVTMARLVTEMQKAIMETKAQAQLNAEDLKAIESKSVEINSTVNKISGKLNAKYSAYKGA